MSRAAAFILIGGLQLFVVLLLVNAALKDSAAPPVKPWDEAPWVPLATSFVSWEELESLEGTTAQTVVQRLGPPVHVNRGWSLPERCAQAYLYVAILEGRRVPCGLCITPEGRAEGLVGGMSFDLRSMSGSDSADMPVAQAAAALLALPAAIIIRVRRRWWPLRVATIR